MFAFLGYCLSAGRAIDSFVRRSLMAVLFEITFHEEGVVCRVGDVM
jgi:hypothetical protein